MRDEHPIQRANDGVRGNHRLLRHHDDAEANCWTDSDASRSSAA
jgi:hypothetical protein